MNNHAYLKIGGGGGDTASTLQTSYHKTILSESFGKITIIIPCYNEEKTIAQVIDEVLSYLPNAYIYVFDNNSSDNSYAIVESKILDNLENKLDSNNKKIEAINSNIYHSANTAFKNNDFKDQDVLNTQNTTYYNITLHKVSTQGKGAVIREAFALVDADYYVMIDADTEHDASILPYALEFFKMQQLDMLNIARDGDSSVYRRGHGFGNKLFSKSTQMLFGTKINDMLSGYRIFSRPFVKSFPAHSNGFEIETELTIYALEQRLRTDEIKAPYKLRPEGSFSKLSTFKDGFKISLMILNLLFSERPLLVFGVLSTLCCLLSLILGVPIFLEFLETSKVARFPTLFVCVGLMVIAVVLCIAGLLAYLITKSIKESRYLVYLQTPRFSTQDSAISIRNKE